MPGHPAFRESRLQRLHALMRLHPLATWAQPSTEGLQLNHLPFLLEAGAGAHGRLAGHLARNHPLPRTAQGAGVLCFHGPQAYVSPGWYPSKAAHGRAVPTWNYVVVHAHGRARFFHDHGWLRRHLEALSAEHEAGQARPWRLDEAPAGFIERGIEALVGIEFEIERLEGIWKCSQNRSAEDHAAVAAQLARSPQGAAMARCMRETLPA